MSPRMSRPKTTSMTLGQHLIELRKRFVRIALGLLVGAVAGWLVAPMVLEFIASPVADLEQSRGNQTSLNFGTISGAFDLKMEIAITVGIALSSPVWLFQIFAFLAPGLNRKEKKYSFGFFFSAVPLFLSGCAAGWLVFPHMVQLLTSFAPGQSSLFLDSKTYVEFALKLVIVIGIAFVIPVFLVLLNFLGVLRGRSIFKAWRLVILSAICFTAIATPASDVASMFLLAIPIIGLFFGAATIGVLHDRRFDKKLHLLDASGERHSPLI